MFQLAGKLVGVQNLTLEEDREMQIAVTASNSRIVDGAEEEYPQGLSKIVGVFVCLISLSPSQQFFSYIGTGLPT